MQNITPLPSRLAIKSWLEMVCFVDIKMGDIYSKKLGWQRAVTRNIENPVEDMLKSIY